MADVVPRVFTREDYEQVRKAQRDLHDASIVMDKAEACGIDVSALRQIKDELMDFLVSIEKEFMSPPPTERKA